MWYKLCLLVFCVLLSAPAEEETMVVKGQLNPPQAAAVWLETGGMAGDLRPPIDVTINCSKTRGIFAVQILDHIEYQDCSGVKVLGQYITETKVALGSTFEAPYLYAVVTRHFTVADKNGQFILENVPPGIYLMRVASPFQGEVRKGLVVDEKLTYTTVDFVTDRSYVTAYDKVLKEIVAVAPIR